MSRGELWGLPFVGDRLSEDAMSVDEVPVVDLS